MTRQKRWLVFGFCAIIVGMFALGLLAILKTAIAVDDIFYAEGVKDMQGTKRKFTKYAPLYTGPVFSVSTSTTKSDDVRVTMTVRVQSMRTRRTYQLKKETLSSWPELWEDALQRMVDDFRAREVALTECEIEMGVKKSDSCLNPDQRRRRWARKKLSKKK